jgi:alkylation response protein AidB-like acyl-CoA dehydrogenase
MAKLLAIEIAKTLCLAAIQVFGGYGCASDFPVQLATVTGGCARSTKARQRSRRPSSGAP